MLRPVVYLPTWVQWNVMKQRPQFLLETFAKAGHEVWFVDPRAEGPERVEGVNVVTSVEAVPHDDVILYLHFAPLNRLAAEFSGATVIYDILDDLSIYDIDEVGLPEDRRVRFHHPSVMERADVVIVSNEILGDRHRSEREDLIHVPNGVDVESFSEPVPPAEDIPPGGPIVGYHGMISHWFDFDLLSAVAKQRPEWRFVLVGPTDPRVEERARVAEHIPNIIRLGERPSSEMPSYVHGFDVGTIWFQINEMTQGVTPLKMFEYLAAGVPCVSTPLPSCVEAEGVVTSSEADSFVAAIEAGLAIGGAERERLAAIGATSDWSTLMEPVFGKLRESGLDRIP